MYAEKLDSILENVFSSVEKLNNIFQNWAKPLSRKNTNIMNNIQNKIWNWGLWELNGRVASRKFHGRQVEHREC